MPVFRSCPSCGEQRKLKCACGHCFRIKKQPLTFSSAPEKHGKQSPSPREQNRVRMAQKRALETEADSVNRREQDKVRKAQKRALETEADSVYRREQSRVLMAQK